MTSDELFAEIDKLLLDRTNASNLLVRIDGALQAFQYILQNDFPGAVRSLPDTSQPAPESPDSPNPPDAPVTFPRAVVN